MALASVAGIFFSAAVNAASVPLNPRDITFTLRARSTSTPLNALQPLINNPIGLDAAGNAIILPDNSLNNVLRKLLFKEVCHARILSIKVI